MTVVSVVAPPPTAPQIHFEVSPASVTQSVIDSVEKRICRAVRASEPIHIWRMLNKLVEEESPPSRDEARSRKLELWQSVNRLLRCQMLFRAGRHGLTTIKPSPPAPRFKQPGRKREKTSTVSHCPSDSVGSAADRTPLREGDNSLEELENHMTTVQCGTGDGVVKTESASPPSQEERSNAARTLALLRWRRAPQRKKLSGWLNKRTRIWRDRQIVLTDGTVAYAYGALRGRVVYFLDQPRQMEPGRWGVVRADGVKPLKIPAAVVLGRLKRGVRETPSPAKQRAARFNGAKQSRLSWSGSGRLAHDD